MFPLTFVFVTLAGGLEAAPLNFIDFRDLNCVKYQISDSNNNNDIGTFRELINQSQEDYRNAHNNILKSEARDKRRHNLLRSLSSLKVKNWHGIITEIDTTSDGRVIFGVEIERSNIVLSTWNNSLSDIFDYSLIEKGSNVYKQVRNLSVGQKVNFSGTFYQDKSDFIREKSVTENGSMLMPEFLFKFTDVNVNF